MRGRGKLLTAKKKLEGLETQGQGVAEQNAGSTLHLRPPENAVTNFA